MEELGITNSILNKISEISALEERFSDMPIKRKWKNDLSQKYIFDDAVATYSLDGGKEDPTSYEEVIRMKNDQDRSVILNEIEIRNSFSLYFKSKEIDEEVLNYVHRLIANTPSTLKQRGVFRKTQEVYESHRFGDLAEVVPRYGFLARFVSEFLKEFEKSNLHYLLKAAILHQKIVELAPFANANARLARVVSRGFLYASERDVNYLLGLDSIFNKKKNSYFSSLKKTLYLDDEDGKDEAIRDWVEFFLECYVEAYKMLGQSVFEVSGGVINPYKKQYISLTKRQEMIIELMKKNHQMSGSEIAQILGVSRQNIHVIMQKLLEKELIEKIGRSTTSRYKLKVIVGET